MPKYAITEDGKLIEWSTSEPYEFIEGIWQEYDGLCGELFIAKPISQEEAMCISSGVMPPTNLPHNSLDKR